MTQEELLDIRGRIANVSTGPWRVAVDDECGDNWLIASLGASGGDGKNYYVTTDHVHASEYKGDAMTDAAFIAHAREDIPALLAENERLCGLLAKADLLIEDLDSPPKSVDEGKPCPVCEGRGTVDWLED